MSDVLRRLVPALAEDYAFGSLGFPRLLSWDDETWEKEFNEDFPIWVPEPIRERKYSDGSVKREFDQ